MLVFAQWEPIIWTDIVGATIDPTNNDLIATSIGWGNVGAASQQVLPVHRNGALKMTAFGTNTYRMLGISTQNQNAHHNTIDYFIYLYRGAWYYRSPENGLKAVASFNDGDEFRLEVDRCEGKVYFTHVGGLTKVVDLTINTSFVADCALYGGVNPECRLNDVYLDGFDQQNNQLVYNEESAYLSNTTILQDLLDQGGAVSLENPCGNSVLYIDRVDLNVDIVLNGNDLRVKRAPILGQLFTPAQLKFHRLFDVKTSTSTATSIAINNLIFDGSIFELNIPYQGYEIEHSALLFLNSNSSLNVALDNCHFYDNGGDAVHVHRNVNFSMTNSTATDCFRGGLTSTGGGSDIFVDGFITYGPNIPTGIDFELDGLGGPNNSIYTVTAELWNLSIDADFDIGVKDNSVIKVYDSKLRTPGLRLSFANSTGRFYRCYFPSGEVNANKARIRAYGDMSFEDCTFEAIGIGTAPISAAPMVLDAGYTNQTLSFNHCQFYTTNPPAAANPIAIGVPFEVSALSNNNTKVFRGCTFGENLTYGFQTYQGTCGAGRGGEFIVEGCDFQCAYPFYFRGHANYPIDLTIRCSNFDSDYFMYARTYTPNTGQNRIEFDDIYVQQSSNYIVTYASNLSQTLVNVGKRTIIGTSAPDDTTHGLIGDEYIFGNQKWVCTKAGYYYGVTGADCYPLSTSFADEPAEWTILGTTLTPINPCYDPQQKINLATAEAKMMEDISGEKLVTELPNTAQSKSLLYPNPFEETFFIDGNQHWEHLRIYSLDGRLIAQQAIASETGTISYDAAHLKSGIYFVELEGEAGNRKTIKVVKM